MRLASSGDQVDGGGGTEHSERNEEMEEDGTGGVCAGQVQAEGQSERSAKLTVLLPLLGLCAITTRCFDANVRSRRVIEKVGFRFVGRAEEDAWRDGKWWTQLLYELTSPEWPDVHTTMRVNRPRPT